MHEHCHPKTRKHYIGSPRKISAMKTKSVAKCMQLTPDCELDRRVLAAYRRHHSTALLGCHDIGTHRELPAVRSARLEAFPLRLCFDRYQLLTLEGLRKPRRDQGGLTQQLLL